MQDLEQCHFFLSMRLNLRPNELLILQQSSMERVLKVAEMKNCNLELTPLPLSHQLYRQRFKVIAMERDKINIKPIQNKLEALIFLST